MHTRALLASDAELEPITHDKHGYPVGTEPWNEQRRMVYYETLRDNRRRLGETMRYAGKAVEREQPNATHSYGS